MIGITPEMVEAGARAAAIHEEYDGCFLRVDEWNALEQWERDAHPEEEPIEDAFQAEWWRDRVRVALHAAAGASRTPIPEFRSEGEDQHD